MGNTKKLLLIGWDAADWKVIHNLMDQGKLPTIKHLVENGVMGNLRTLIPMFSPMLWTSIATGKRPFKHGICGFYEPTVDEKNVQPMTNISRKCKAIWNILNQQDLESLVVGWWPSHPAEPINGVMVSDYFHKAPRKPGDPWNLLPSSVYPRELLKEVAEFRVHPLEMRPEHILPFVPEAPEIDQSKDPRLSSIMRMLAECTTIHATSTYLLETQPWDFCAIYNDAIDHFCHGFMKFYPPQQATVNDRDFRLYHQVVASIYVYHDMMLKRLLELADEETTVLLVSDHGFHPDHLRPTKISTEPAGPAKEHREFGIFLAMGPGIKKDHVIHGANLLDVAPTILSLFGLPVGDDMDGQVLTDLFVAEPEVKSIPSWEDVAGNDGQHPADMKMESAESKAALDQLVALGYIDPPSENTEDQVAKSKTELDYNLARSYMDAEMHGEAIPLLNRLYLTHPLEYRFGVQLCNCLKAMGRIDELEQVVNHLNASWRQAAEVAKTKIREIAKIVKQRRAHFLELKKLEDQDEGQDQAPNPNGRPKIIDENERFAIRKLRAVARGNPQTLDYLAAVVAVSKDDFEQALECLERAELTKSPNPGFQYHVGNVYLGLQRFDDAERSFQRALEFDENHANSLMGLCRTYLEMNRSEQALGFGRQAVGLNFHFPLGHYFYATARLKTGDVTGAITSLKTAVEQNPNFAQAHELLTQIYSQSQIDAELAKVHQVAAKSVEVENEEVLGQYEPIELPDLEQIDLAAELPGLSDGINSEFLRPLAQPKIQPDQTTDDLPSVVIVSGLPRSGTSMMMQMLVAGGLEPFTDRKRSADENNPNGYFEADVVKQIAKNNAWINQCGSKVVKVVAPLIQYLPQAANYKVVLMERSIDEVLSSQYSMLMRLNQELPDAQQIEREKETLAKVFKFQLRQAVNLLRVHGHELMTVSFAQAMQNPMEIAEKVGQFVGCTDIEKMKATVDPTLHRERK